MDYQNEFCGKNAVVIGSAGGIGRAVASLMAARGARVVMADNQAEKGKKEAEALADKGFPVSFFPCDVTSLESVRKLAGYLEREIAGIHILSYNAGIMRYGSATEISPDKWNDVVNVNLTGVYFVARSIIPLMLKGGAIVLTASVLSFMTQHGNAAYTAAKSGLLGLTRSMAVDFIKKGIRINAVCPGTVDTPMTRWAAEQSPDPGKLYDAVNKMHPIGRIARPEEIAEAICFLAGDRASFIVGSALTVDGGLSITVGGSPVD